ncbi:hypothetical protein RCS94_06685 [Orbaceae bacterium ac157xtp]
MAFFKRLSEIEINERFTTKGWYCGIVPVYIDKDRNGRLAIEARNWVPDWAITAVDYIFENIFNTDDRFTKVSGGLRTFRYFFMRSLAHDIRNGLSRVILKLYMGDQILDLNTNESVYSLVEEVGAVTFKALISRDYDSVTTAVQKVIDHIAQHEVGDAFRDEVIAKFTNFKAQVNDTFVYLAKDYDSKYWKGDFKNAYSVKPI